MLIDLPLTRLKDLRKLGKRILYKAYDGVELHIEGGFQKLKHISLMKLEELKSVKIDVGALPLLENLYIGYKTLPL